MATIPDPQTKENFDADADDPKLARAEFADNVDKFNTLRTVIENSLIQEASTISDLQSRTLSDYQTGDILYLRGRNSQDDGGQGLFILNKSDLSTEVAGDEVTPGEGDGGIYIAPTGDKTGASGAWVRAEKVGWRDSLWYGKSIAVKESKSRLSLNGWTPEDEPIFGRSTPETATLSVGDHIDQLGGASRNYKWGINAWLTNPSTAPLTAIDAMGMGWKARGMGATARQFGDDGDAHAHEVLVGQWRSQADVQTTNGSTTLVVNEVTRRGSRFSPGNPIAGTNIPSNSEIVSVTKDGQTFTGDSVEKPNVESGGSGYQVDDVLTVDGGTNTFPAELRVLSVDGSGAVTQAITHNPGNYSARPSDPVSVSGGNGSSATFNLDWIKSGAGNPDEIEIDNSATGTSSSVEVNTLNPDTLNIGVLITGSGDGGNDGTGNPNGRAIQLQSQQDAAFRYGINIPNSALRDSDGIGVRFTGVTAQSGLTFESCTMDEALRISGGTYTNVAVNVLEGGIGAGRESRDTTGADGTDGVTLNTNGLIAATADAFYSLSLNRTTDNGDVARFRRAGSAVGSISVDGSSTSYNTSSDERLKTNFRLTTEPGEKIGELANILAEYEWHADGKLGYGVSAQEAQAFLPDIIKQGKGRPGDQDFEPWGIDWSKAVPYLIAYCKRLEERIRQLENRS